MSMVTFYLKKRNALLAQTIARFGGLILIILFAFSNAKSQVIRYVKPTGLMSFNYQGPHSWQNNQSYRGLQEAIMASSAGDEIWVAAGVYKSNTDSTQQYGNPDPRLRVFVLKEGVKIFGGFPGLPGQEGNFSIRDPSLHISVLSADINENDPQPWAGFPNVEPWSPPLDDNAYAIVINQGFLTNATILDGFFLRGANNYGVPNEVRTGAINLSFMANPVIRSCHFSDNYNLYRGGAVTLSGSSPTIFGCVFERNIGTGAGIYTAANSLIQIENCLFRNNWGGDSGGALSVNHGSKVNLINSIFVHNHASVGGALFVYSSHNTTVTAQNCIWWGNGFLDANNNINFSQVAGRLFYVSGADPNTAEVKVANSVFWNNGPMYSGAAPNTSTDGIFKADPNQLIEISNSNVEHGWPRKNSGIITVNPMFINPPQDFNVMSGSPLVNPNLPQIFFFVPNDYNGNPRDNNPDLGAYEYDPILALANIKVSKTGNLYPNPAGRTVQIDTPTNYSHFEIYDHLGRVVYKNFLRSSIVNLPLLPDGLYQFKAFERNDAIPDTYKLIIKN